MKFGIKKSNKILFFYKGYEASLKNQDLELDVVLSCDFYWVRIFNIPTKSIKEAKKTLPALFEDILPSGNYDYMCVKLEDNKYVAFAYDNDEILQALKQSNLNVSKIKSLRFAQTEMLSYENSIIEVNSDYLLSYENGILIKLPFNLGHKEIVNIGVVTKNIKLSQNRVDFKFYTTLIDSNIIKILTLLFLSIALINMVKYINIHLTISQLDKQKEEQILNYELPKTSLQLNSILDELLQNDKKQAELKVAIDYILKFQNISQYSTIHKFLYSKNKIIVSFNEPNEQAIKNYLSKKYKILSSRKDGDTFVVEVGL